ncbi:MAG: two-component system sensor histidine kinase/response regulator [Colwellia sp.]|jgi:two-component system sensor histidine kinase/response regulator
MSHEIRILMNFILSILGLLLRNDLSEEQVYRVELANSTTEELLHLLNGLVDYFRYK